MPEYREVQPHGTIKEIFPDVFMVMGTNKIHHNDTDIQVSRNMIIVREAGNLTLINTVRLNDKELTNLDKIGKVVNVVKIGAFHGYDDAFYLDRYHATFWAMKGMKHDSGRMTDIELEVGGPMPLSNCSLFNFETIRHLEGILMLNYASVGNILITCDSIQNWTIIDEFFSESSGKLFQENGFIRPANIPDTWIEACQPQPNDLQRIKSLSFNHLLSAHGQPLKDNAHEVLCETLRLKFKI